MRDSGGYSPPAKATPAWLTAIVKPKITAAPANPLQVLASTTPARPAPKATTAPKTSNVSNSRPVNVAGPSSNSGATPPISAPSGLGGIGAPPVSAQPSTSSSDYAKRAAYAVAQNINPQQDALRSSLTQGNNQYNFDAASNQANTDRRINELKDVSSRLSASQNSQIPTIGANYDQQSAGTKGNFDALQAAISQNYNGAISNTSNEANRLGLQAATPQATAQMQSDQKFLSGLAGNNSALAQSNIGQQKATSLSDALNAITSGAREGANLQGQTIREATSASNVARFAQGQANQGFRDKINSLEGTRKGSEYEQLASLMAADAARARQQRQQDIDNDIAYGGLGVKQQGANTASAAQRSDAALNIARGNQANASAAKTAAEATAANGAGLDPNSPEGYAWLQTAAGQKATADIANTLASATKTAGEYQPGQSGAQQYLKTTLANTDPNFYAAAAPLFNNILNRVNNGANDYTASKVEANKRMKSLGWSEEMQGVFMAALGIAYNNTGDAKKKSV